MNNLVSQKKYATILFILAGLFAFRVFAQVLQLLSPVPWLPPFDSWHSETLPYFLLLTIQLVLFVFLLQIAHRILKNKTVPKRKRGKAYIIIGIIYFVFMIFRLILGQTIYTESIFWYSWLPTIFHHVLASFVIVNGVYHFTKGKK